MDVPSSPKIYHIAHLDGLPGIIQEGCLWCDAEMIKHRVFSGTCIGMNKIKERRLNQLTLTSHPDLYVGQCVPFYFCPRSVMLYLLYQGNHPELDYTQGQEPIVHLEADLHKAVAWAEKNRRRWAFTLSNAGSYYFEDRCDLSQLHEINWKAVQAHRWSGTGISPDIKEEKQAEFLLEHSFPWALVERVGVISDKMLHKTSNFVARSSHRPPVEVRRDWYY